MSMSAGAGCAHQLGAVLMAEACIIGPNLLIIHNIPALTRHRLSQIKQKYLRAEIQVSVHSRLVDFEYILGLASRWGSGTEASADCVRFVTPLKTVNSGPKKIFRFGRGITWYNFVSVQYYGFHVIVPRHIAGFHFSAQRASGAADRLESG